MKLKIFWILLIVFLVALGTVFANDYVRYQVEKYVGKWTCTSAKFSNIEVDVDSVLDGKDCGFELYLNGDAKIELPGEDATGDWEKVNKGVRVGNTELRSTRGELRTEMNGVTLIFTKDSGIKSFIEASPLNAVWQKVKNR